MEACISYCGSTEKGIITCLGETECCLLNNLSNTLELEVEDKEFTLSK
jgi:hypothetical protein